jgi:hypothetical protein
VRPITGITGIAAILGGSGNGCDLLLGGAGNDTLDGGDAEQRAD